VTARNGRGFALGPVDLSLSEGVTCLVGANGAGKSTLFRVLVGIQKATGGLIQFADHRPSIGYLPQEPELPPLALAGGYLDHVAWLQGIRRGERAAAVDTALAAAGMTDRSSSPIRKLSGGMRRRLAFAGAIVNQPRLLLLDEPTVGLDPIQRERIRQLVKATAPNRAVLLSTHLLEDVRALAAHVVILAAGRVVFSGAPAQLTSTPTGSANYAVDFDAAAALMAVDE
jgi:ABC-2 type transport system ATP-binding protein